MELEKQRGQALVETSLVLPVMLLMLLGLLDPAFAVLNHALGKYYAFKAAREASIFLADGSDTCYQESVEAAFAGLGEPILIMVDTSDSANWSLSVTPCPDDPSWSQVSGTFVTATLTWDQDRIFWGDWSGQSAEMVDVFQ